MYKYIRWQRVSISCTRWTQTRWRHGWYCCRRCLGHVCGSWSRSLLRAHTSACWRLLQECMLTDSSSHRRCQSRSTSPPLHLARQTKPLPHLLLHTMKPLLSHLYSGSIKPLLRLCLCTGAPVGKGGGGCVSRHALLQRAQHGRRSAARRPPSRHRAPREDARACRRFHTGRWRPVADDRA